MDNNFKNSKVISIQYIVSPLVQTITSLSPEVVTKLSEFGSEKAESNFENSKDI